MFCKNCGKEISEGTKFCPNCGANCSSENSFSKAANDMFNATEKELGSAINEVRQSFNGGYQGNVPPYGGERLKDDRGLVSYIILNIITCGIYGYYFLYKMAHDINIACEGDGENTSGLAAFIILSFVTCGIYAWFWYYKLGNRLAENAPRYGMNFQENGTTVLLWLIFGAFLCGIGPFIAMHILIKNSNRICNAYNRAHGLI
ncbi:DUF4234 domain-containing protein [Butyribacter sp.]|uniref:DUF4234 domain-containing protein n=1 Tax=Butyribacter sp. TaxID=2822465 RepID=UPI002A9A1DD9|nr:DUF4234 domain-containing protein [Butyribacter sp.]